MKTKKTKATKKEPTRTYKRRSVAIDDELWQELETIAKEEERSISWLVRDIINKAI